MTKGSLGDIKSLHFTTILNVQHARSHERVAMVSRRIRVLPQFWASDTSEVTKGLLGHIQNLHFTTVLSVRHVRSDERVARAGARICILPQFWASDTSEVTKGSRGEVKNLRFTTVLSVRHARSDERVDQWREGRSATSKICVLPQFWASDTHEVTRGLSNPQVRSLRPRQKKNIF